MNIRSLVDPSAQEVYVNGRGWIYCDPLRLAFRTFVVRIEITKKQLLRQAKSRLGKSSRIPDLCSCNKASESVLTVTFKNIAAGGVGLFLFRTPLCAILSLRDDPSHINSRLDLQIQFLLGPLFSENLKYVRYVRYSRYGNYRATKYRGYY